MRREDLVELAPMLRRAISLDRSALTRIRGEDDRISALVRLPFGVLAARTVTVTDPMPQIDTAMRAGELVAWLDGDRASAPEARDAEWRTGLPPTSGWQRIDTVPDADVRSVVRSGARALRDAAEREGLPGAQPRAEVADALLDAVVLTVTESTRTAEISLRTLSALTRLGFLPTGSHIAVDLAGRWIRVAAEYGSVYAERPGLGLSVR
ncbi:MAG TPA: hypothetical protein VFE19_07790 [Jatrophihabitantaceae bacterium]|nr:hypothetical protein [Jatrophihabitantaceae bacterium]